ncbi:Obscurin [Labeo rohita]|uniref:Obscurin n=1 Tax=Labeo rohita TaxID=84645 RepID=A0ABQ8LLV9_LABRO|nr:Obscurin [Labeo rohita]
MKQDIVPVSVIEGDTVTLYTDIETNQQEEIRWYFNDIHSPEITGNQTENCTDVQCNNGTELFRNNDILIAEITENQSKICTDVQCKDANERFRDRLKLDNQTASLTITNINTRDSGLYKLQINGSTDSLAQLFNVSVFYAPEQDNLKLVKAGESVILDPDVVKKTNYLMKWLFNDIRIAEINGDLSFICTDVQCLYADVRFRDRLKLNHRTGSLTITNTRNTDSGLYYLLITTIRFSIKKSFIVNVTGYVDAERVSVMEGDTVTIYTGVKTNQQEEMRWYFNDIRIAQITKDLSFICTDVQCKYSDARFRDRLKLDHHTGSLTITNTGTTDSGLYHNQVISGSRVNHTIFSVTVYEVPAAERDEMKIKSVKESDSVTLYTSVMKNPNDLMTWYFNDICIAEITRDNNTDEQCEDRFRDRLKLDHQTGSLTITNIRTTESGLYKLQINSGRISITKSFNVTVAMNMQCIRRISAKGTTPEIQPAPLSVLLK